MKNLLLFAIAILTLTTSCGDDDGVDGPIFTEGGTVLSYDNPNFSAPQLPQGIYEAAVRFPSSLTSALEGQFLRQVAVYLTNVPASTEIIVYTVEEGSQTLIPVYNADVGAQMTTDSWNVHSLSTPVEITGRDLWVSVKVDHPAQIGSVGCDEGPARQNGDFIAEEGDTQWSNLRTFANSDVNWNIKANILN